jgi:hypothetical protein
MVMAAKVSAARVRNGPPEAVSHSFATLCEVSPGQALVQGAVFGIDGQEFRAPLALLAGHEFAGHDQGFLVGEGHVLARPDGGQGGHQAHGPDRGRHHQIGLARRGHRGDPRFSDSHLDAGEIDEPLERAQDRFGSHRDDLGPVFGDLRG